MEKRIAITGTPRSGTTLTCHLLNKIENTIALHEPIRPEAELAEMNRNEMLEFVSHFFDTSRKTLLTSGVARTKHREGQIPDNSIIKENMIKAFYRKQIRGRKRSSNLDKGEIHFDKPLNDQFLLAIKHPPLFTALLPELDQNCQVFAIVRNPLAVLLSWNSVVFNVSRGHSPTAEMVDSTLKSMLAKEPDKLKRQAKLIHWFLTQYVNFLNPSRIIKYEDIISSGGSVLKKIHPSAKSLQEPLQTKNMSKDYDRKLVNQLCNELEAIYTNELEAIYRFEEIEKLKKMMVTTQ